MRSLVALVLLVGCGKGGGKASNSCESVAERAVTLHTRYEGSSRPEVDTLLRAAVIKDCERRKFDADDYACVANAEDIRALADCDGLRSLSKLLPPELECPNGTTLGKSVLQGKYNVISCEREGKRSGPAIRYKDDGEVLAELTYADGILDGPYTAARGEVKGIFKVGKLDGPWTVTGFEGKNPIVVNFIAGTPDGEYSRADDKETVRGSFRAGRRTGEWSYFWPEGGEKARGGYDDDKRVGSWSFFHEATREDTIRATPVDAGAKRSEWTAAHGSYKAGVRQPGWKFFAEADGKPIDEPTAMAGPGWLGEAVVDDPIVDQAVINALLEME